MSENAKVNMEQGQDFVPMEQLTDSGDAITFQASESLFSGADGTDIVVRLDGITTGGVMVPTTATNDSVDVASSGFNIGGVTATAAADAVTITRAATLTHSISSITVDVAGNYVEVVGTEGSAFSETRGAAGGPPFVPVDEVEVGQVRTTAGVGSPAPITTVEIKQVTGQHTERSDAPLFNVNSTDGLIVMTAALKPIHTGSVTREVFAEYSTPIFAELQNSYDFVPAEISNSATSQQVYGNVIATVSSTLNQATFNEILKDGVNDPVAKLKGQSLWFEFFPDRFKSAKILTQGKLAIGRTFPADGNNVAACTITPSEESKGFIS